MSDTIKAIILGAAFVLLAPFVGGFLTGLDRIITARFQGRKGPPVLQPFYDVGKLFGKDSQLVHQSQLFYVFSYLFFMVFTGVLFFTGMDFLLIIFSLTLANVFLILGAYASHSPFATIGGQRELLQIMAYEPLILFTAIGFYMATSPNSSFYVRDIFLTQKPLITLLPGMFIAMLLIIQIKLRKSPFDLAFSHHPHQELVKGVTTDFSGKTLGLIEIAHWYESIFLLGFVYLFFSWSPILGAVVTFLAFSLFIIVDNVTARLKYGAVIVFFWIAAAVLGISNIVYLYIVNHPTL